MSFCLVDFRMPFAIQVERSVRHGMESSAKLAELEPLLSGASGWSLAERIEADDKALPL